MRQLLFSRGTGPLRGDLDREGGRETALPHSTVHAAMLAAGLDFPLVHQPLEVQALGYTLPVPGRHTISRPGTSFDPEPAVLGVVGDAHQMVTNLALARRLDESTLLDRHPVRRVVPLRRGAATLVVLGDRRGALRAPFPLHGGRWREGFMVLHTHDGTHAPRLTYTPTLANEDLTLFLGVPEATADLFSHLASPSPLQEAREYLRRHAQGLCHVSLSPTRAAATIERALPLDPTRSRDQVDGLRQTAYTFFRRRATFDEHPSAETAWSLYLALVELAHSRSERGTGDRLLGTAARDMGRAWNAMLDLLTPNYCPARNLS